MKDQETNQGNVSYPAASIAVFGIAYSTQVQAEQARLNNNIASGPRQGWLQTHSEVRSVLSFRLATLEKSHIQDLCFIDRHRQMFWCHRRTWPSHLLSRGARAGALAVVDEIVKHMLMEIQPRIGTYVTVYNGPAGCQKAGFTNDEATGKNHAHQETLR